MGIDANFGTYDHIMDPQDLLLAFLKELFCLAATWGAGLDVIRSAADSIGNAIGDFIIDVVIPIAAVIATTWVAVAAWKTSQRATQISEQAFRSEERRVLGPARAEWRDALLAYLELDLTHRTIRERWTLQDLSASLALDDAEDIQVWVHRAEDMLLSHDHSHGDSSRYPEGMNELRRDTRDKTLIWMRTGKFDTSTPFTCAFLEERPWVQDEFPPDKLRRGIPSDRYG